MQPRRVPERLPRSNFLAARFCRAPWAAPEYFDPERRRNRRRSPESPLRTACAAQTAPVSVAGPTGFKIRRRNGSPFEAFPVFLPTVALRPADAGAMPLAASDRVISVTSRPAAPYPWTPHPFSRTAPQKKDADTTDSEGLRKPRTGGCTAPKLYPAGSAAGV